MPIYLYCKMGSRAEFAAGVLKERGYTKVTTLGGLGDMEALGFKFEKNRNKVASGDLICFQKV